MVAKQALPRISVLLLSVIATAVGGAAASAAGPAERALRTACAADYRRLCRDAGTDASAIETCLRRKRGQVSPECQDAAVALGARVKAERAARAAR